MMEMNLLKLLPFLHLPEEEPKPQTLALEGPFLLEEEALKYPQEYHELLEQTWLHSNLIISRDLLITCPDPTYEARDNLRLEAGITHHSHQLELFVNSHRTVEPLAIDHFILLNPRDIRELQSYFTRHPLNSREIHSIICH
jgi:hypothetical protein